MAMQQECVVTNECVYELIDFFATRGTQYLAKLTDRKYEVVEKMCLHLLARDYYVQTIDNSNGSLCPHYPSHLIVLERESTERDRRKLVNDYQQLQELFTIARSARCFCRFPVPVILFNKKNICRSSTLSTAAEQYGRSGLEWLFSGSFSGSRKVNEEDLPPWQHERKQSEWGLVDQAREYDSQLIQRLGVGLICDLMVEMRKTAYGVTVTSSEKADGNHWYSRYTIASIPYPGCEFFHKYRNHSKHAEELRYDWSKSLNDATLSIPSPLPESTGIAFNNYQSWNVVKLTQNYLKLILHYLSHEDGGVLVHCVSGWDRTPLYISLIRLSLWADGSIHSSLSESEILYLTLAYDWFMFGHKFEERLRKHEEVLFFCFDFLKYITSEEYSITTVHATPETTPTGFTSCDRTTPTGAMSCDRTTQQQSTMCSSVAIPNGSSNTTVSDDTDICRSLSHVSLDECHGSCLYRPSFIKGKPSSHSTTRCESPNSATSERGRRLLTVREIFLAAYKKALPPVINDGGGASTSGGLMSGLMGLGRMRGGV